MSCDDSIPVGVYDDFETDEEREEFLTETFADITTFEFERRRYHDQSGFFAHEVGSPACLALGHPIVAELGDDPLHEDDVHVMGWDTQVCKATEYGSACTYCEGECDHTDTTPSLWSMVADVEIRRRDA